MADRARLTLYSREYCHLCSDMLAALAPLCAELGIEVDVIDVDADPELVRRFDETVPVLMHRGVELARGRLEASAVRAYLAKIG
ncbi:MAG: glutaredoxin family protein [Betaproteobacteria bacterium]|nr:glutaredoxin family protein [Betaproteobacteria bacterium]